MKRVAKTLKQALVLWVGLSLIPIAYYYHLSDKAHQFLLSRMEAQGSQFLSFVETKATRLHHQIEKTFYGLSHSPLLVDFALTNNPKYRGCLESQWYLTSLNSGLFYQLRYLDNTGKEVIRVDSTPQMTHPFIVPIGQLQDKSQRDYFNYAQQLTPGEQGYFGIDLEYEHGLPVIPYKPGFRILYPIDTLTGRQGYFIANLDVMNVIHQITENNQDLNVDFIDQHGFFVVSSDENKLFGDLIQARASHNLPNEYPLVWQAIQATGRANGSVMTDEGLFIFQPFNNQLFSSVGGMTLLTHYSPQVLQQTFKVRDKQILSDSIVIWLGLGLISGVLGMMLEAHRRMRMDQTYAQFVMENGVAIAFTNREHRILRANTRFSEMVGIEMHLLPGRMILDLLPSGHKQKLMLGHLQQTGEWKGQYSLQDPEGHEVVCKTEVRALAGKLSKVHYYVYSFTDISEHYNAIVELKERSERDPATSLWNKKKFENTLQYYARLKQRYQNQPPTCLAIIDIDSFKEVNDSLGHAVGDEVIRYVATQLQALLRDTDFIARIGGDEFAVIIQHTDIHQAIKLMQRVCVAISSWPQHKVTISVGVAEVLAEASQTMTHADQAMYRSKRKGKNCVSAHGFENLTVVESHHV
ncbi:GGDEF domain-containing protein [Vibrio fluvialis]|nr:GGDEF domain-containing protein [Vibrio fluvialis]